MAKQVVTVHLYDAVAVLQVLQYLQQVGVAIHVRMHNFEQLFYGDWTIALLHERSELCSSVGELG